MHDHPTALLVAGPRPREDRRVVERAIATSPRGTLELLAAAGEELKRDRALVALAVRMEGMALEHAPAFQAGLVIVGRAKGFWDRRTEAP